MKTYNVVKSCQVPGLNKIYMDAFGFKTDGSFVEVGAYDGVAWSNTNCLAQVGWKGLMFEPVPAHYKRCVANHKKHKKVKVVQCCIGDHNGDTKVYLGGALSTTSPEMVDIFNKLSWSKRQRHNKKRFIESKIYTLDHMLEKHDWNQNFDVLVVDTEGTELEVLKGFSVDKWAPKIAIVEASEKHKDKEMGRHAGEINEYFESHGYDKIYCGGVNSVFLKRDA